MEKSKMNAKVKKWIEKDGIKFLQGVGLKKGQVVLDFSCGVGHYTIPATKIVGRGGKIYALDKDRNALKKLRKLIQQNNIKNAELINESSKTSINDESVDAVLCYDVIHYEKKNKRVAVYSEIQKVLKKDGLFSIYPKHYKEDYPLMELADIKLEDVIKEIKATGFVFRDKFLKNLLHDSNFNQGYILNFRKN